MKRLLAIGIILLFIGMTISSSTGLYVEKQSSISTLDGNTLYVGGNGTGNYSKIQDAIDNASDGDTVFVYNGIYYEFVEIDKSINLIGENRNSTIIDASDMDNAHAILINANYNNIQGFTLTGGWSGTAYSGVYIKSDFNTVGECNFINSEGSGITVYGCNNLISDNFIAENENYGIWLVGRPQIVNNTISNNSIIFNGWDGISSGDAIYVNSNKIYHNDIINNRRRNARDECNNSWDDGYPSGGNHWDDYNGVDYFSGPNQDIPGSDDIGDTPYWIYGGNNSDRYPLMNPLKEYDEPMAYFTYDVDDLTVTFNGDLSFDPDGTIATWLWDFGDGVEGAGIYVHHTYQIYGIYNVTLTVTDNEGKKDNITKTIIVEKHEMFKFSLIVGKLDNLTFDYLFGISFEAIRIRVISFSPINYEIGVPPL